MVDKELVNKISYTLKEHGLTVATAESCTGGLLSSVLTDVSGSSDYFMCGIVSYSNSAKSELLGVSKEDVECYGAVSETVAKSMAEGVRKRSGVDIGVSTTGIAGPTGGTKEKPVGLVFIGVSTKKDVVVKRFVFDGDRLENKNSACTAALNMVLELVQ